MRASVHRLFRFSIAACLLAGLALMLGGCEDSDDDVTAQALGPLTNGNLPGRIAANERFGSFEGMRTSIAVDSAGQAHVVTDVGGIADGRPLTVFHRRGRDSWTAGEVLPISGADAELVYGPAIRIDDQDRAWMAAHFFTAGNYDQSGQGLWTIDNVRSATTLRWLGLKHFGPWGGWLNPILAFDEARPGTVFVFTGDGVYTVVNSRNEVVDESQLELGQTGEQHAYDIGQRPGQSGILHGCQSGSAPDESPHNPASYMNSIMSGPVVVADPATYEQDNEQAHPGLAADLANPATAYFGCVWDRGLFMNIWNGSLNGGAGGLVRPANNLIALDHEAPSLYRMNQPLAAAVGGGCWVVWGAEDRIRLALVQADGQVGERIDIGAGQYPNLCVDRYGNVHLAFASGGQMRYVKIRMSTGG